MIKITEDIKIHVKNHTQSRRVQEWAFKQGFIWNGETKPEVQHTDVSYLFFEYERKKILMVSDTKYFNKHSDKEITYEQIFPKFKEGDRVRLLGTKSTGFSWDAARKYYHFKKEAIEVIAEIEDDILWINTPSGDVSTRVMFLLEDVELVKEGSKLTNKYEVNKMELKNIKKENLKEAKKQYEVEKMNEEIEYAKKQMYILTNTINGIDRQIKSLNKEKEEYLEKLKPFSK